MEIREYLTSQKQRVDEGLRRFLLEVSGWPVPLKEAMAYSLDAGGKRIRPILALAAAEALGGNAGAVLPVACALECIHTFSLIHDDLPSMDNDDLRRGHPTNHKVFGEGMAILAGDGLLAFAVTLLCETARFSVLPAVLLDVIRDISLATGPSGMVGGQVYDLKAEGADLSEADLERLHRFKTGRLIAVSVTGGAKIAGANPAQLEALKQYGERIGLAFQIADDILNVEGSVAQTGKSVGSDGKHNKATYPKILGLEASRARAQKLCGEAIQSLSDFDERADPLRELARFIILRKN